MANPTPEVIGIIVSGTVAGVVLIIVFVIIAVYCYRVIDRADDKTLVKSQRNIRFIENGGYLGEPVYYGDGTSSIGTAARLAPSYPIPVLVGAPAHHPGDGYHSGATTLEKKKRKKALVNYQHSRSKYDEREGYLDFDEETQETVPAVLKVDNPRPDPVSRPDDDEPVIVTYLEDPYEETEVKTVPKHMDGLIPPPPPPPILRDVATADPDNGERTPSLSSDPDDGTEAYHHRQREPPKGDIGPPEYQVSRL